MTCDTLIERGIEIGAQFFWRNRPMLRRPVSSVFSWIGCKGTIEAGEAGIREEMEIAGTYCAPTWRANDE